MQYKPLQALPSTSKLAEAITGVLGSMAWSESGLQASHIFHPHDKIPAGPLGAAWTVGD